MKHQKTGPRTGSRKKTTVTQAVTGLRRHDPKRAAIKRRMRRQSPLHKRIILHPLSVMIVLCAGVFITSWTYQVVADYYSLTAKVAAPTLMQPATITSPGDGTVITTSPIDITGTCPTGSYVKLNLNGSFSGAAWCAPDNTFIITTDLSAGQNTLAAQDYNVTDDPGPASPDITVTYSLPVTTTAPTTSQPPTATAKTIQQSTSSTSGTSSPLLLSSDFHYQTYVVGRTYSWTLQASGGVAPYKVLSAWGDGSTSTLMVPHSQAFTISHTYKTTGHFAVLVKMTDSVGAAKDIQLVAVIKPLAAAAPRSTTCSNCTSTADLGGIWGFFKDTGKLLLIAWPPFIVVSLMLVSYWLGERAKIAHLHHK
jgi:hypothetical protein